MPLKSRWIEITIFGVLYHLFGLFCMLSQYSVFIAAFTVRTVYIEDVTSQLLLMTLGDVLSGLSFDGVH